MLESELGLLFMKAGRLAEAKDVVEKGKVAVDDLQVSFVGWSDASTSWRALIRVVDILRSLIDRWEDQMVEWVG